MEAKNQFIDQILTALNGEFRIIGDYNRYINQEQNPDDRHTLAYVQEANMRHVAMLLELLCRNLPQFKKILEGVLFQEGDIVLNAEHAYSAFKERTPEELIKDYLTSED